MNERLIIAFLSLLFIGSLAAVFVLWAKLDEQKQKATEERKRRWQETSIMLTVENEKDAQIHNLRIRNSLLNHEIEAVELKNRDLQDRLSSAFCPSNNHVWQDGVCTKCGRIQDE